MFFPAQGNVRIFRLHHSVKGSFIFNDQSLNESMIGMICAKVKKDILNYTYKVFQRVNIGNFVFNKFNIDE
jgi:hypothetical protein